MSERTGAVRCQCTLASESQITDIFRKFAADHPAQDISYDDVTEGINEAGRENAQNLDRYGSGERQCFGCDPMVHMLVSRFNENAHDVDVLFPKLTRQGGRKAKVDGLCGVAASRDYTAANDGIPDLRGSAIKAPKKQ